jgi:hypothetical protein
MRGRWSEISSVGVARVNGWNARRPFRVQQYVVKLHTRSRCGVGGSAGEHAPIRDGPEQPAGHVEVADQELRSRQLAQRPLGPVQLPHVPSGHERQVRGGHGHRPRLLHRRTDFGKHRPSVRSRHPTLAFRGTQSRPRTRPAPYAHRPVRPAHCVPRNAGRSTRSTHLQPKADALAVQAQRRACEAGRCRMTVDPGCPSGSRLCRRACGLLGHNRGSAPQSSALRVTNR